MKKILIFLTCLCVTISVTSQVTYDPNRLTFYRYTYGVRYSRVVGDSLVSIPKDTMYSKEGIARIGTKAFIGDGSKWTEIQGGGGAAIISVQSLIDRDALPAPDRYDGLISYVRDSLKYYSLVGGIANINWQEFAGGGSSVGVINADSQQFTASASQTNFTPGFTLPPEEPKIYVWRNGVQITFIKSSNTIIILSCDAGDIILIKCVR